MSSDPSTGVGAALVSITVPGKPVWLGYNYLVEGSPASFWEDRSVKYDHVVHAEEGVILSAGEKARGGLLISTHHLCKACAKLAVTAGIGYVCMPTDPWRDDPDVIASCRVARGILDRGGVRVIQA